MAVRSSSLRLTLAALAVLVTCGACASTRIGSYRDPSFDPAPYRGYTWSTFEPSPTGDRRLDADTLFDARVREAVEAALVERGYVRGADKSATFEVHYHALVKEQIDIFGVDEERGYDLGEFPHSYEACTLTIELINPETGHLLWRGWAQTDISGMLDHPAWVHDAIGNTARRILKQLPEK